MLGLTKIKGTDDLYKFKGYVLKITEFETQYGKGLCASFRKDTEDNEDLYVALNCWENAKADGISIYEILKNSEKRFVVALAKGKKQNGKMFYNCIDITTFPYDDVRKESTTKKIDEVKVNKIDDELAEEYLDDEEYERPF